MPFPSLSSRRDPAPVKTGGGDPYLPPLFPRRSCPREDGGWGVNPVPDNILSRRGGSRTARPPNPTVIPTHHSVVPAQIPTPKHGGGNPSPPPSYLTSPHCYNCPTPPLFPRRDPAPVKTGDGNPSLSPLFPRRACPRENGAGTHPHYPHIIPSAAQRSRGILLPYPSLSSRRDPATVTTGTGTHPSLRCSRAEPTTRANGDGNPPPSPRCPRGCGDPSLSPLFPRRRKSITHPPRTTCHSERSRGIPQPFPSLSSRRDPALVKTGAGNPSPLPTCHSECSEAEPRNLVALPLVVLASRSCPREDGGR